MTKDCFIFYVMTKFVNMVMPEKNQELGFSTGEMVHWPKWLAHKCEDQSSDL